MNASTQKVLFSSKTDQHATPRAFAAHMVARFRIEFDVCASKRNAVVPSYYTRRQNALNQLWHKRAGVLWMNPPYGRDISLWIAKAARESMFCCKVVCLLPSRTDTRWWHDIVQPRASLIEFIRGRLHFNDRPDPAPFPSVLVVFG